MKIHSANIVVSEEAEFNQWLFDLMTVKDRGPELLSVLREICAATTKPDLMIAITKGQTLIEKLPKL